LVGHKTNLIRHKTNSLWDQTNLICAQTDLICHKTNLVCDKINLVCAAEREKVSRPLEKWTVAYDFRTGHAVASGLWPDVSATGSTLHQAAPQPSGAWNAGCFQNGRFKLPPWIYGGVDIADGAMAVILAESSPIIIERRGRRC
jgi:hypothetical protein